VTTSSHEPDDPEVLEADPADLADQRLPADSSMPDDGDAAVDEDLPIEADPADVAEQRREVPPEEPEP
jgi:hypothetical protein